MDKNLQKHTLVNLMLCLALAVGTFAVARATHSLAGQVAVSLLCLGFVIGLVSWFHMRLEERERLERLEFDEASRSRTGSSTLFAADEGQGDSLLARRAREQFERYFVPGF